MVQVSIMPCKAMSDTLDVPFSAAVTCIEWCKTNFENMASEGGRQKTGIYTTAWGANTARDSGTLRTAIQQAGEGLAQLHGRKWKALMRHACRAAQL
jgi:hypothetical protein